MPRPSIVYTHGAWHYPKTFDKVRALLEPEGYRCVTVSMPSVAQRPVVTSLDEDIAAVRAAVMNELDAGYDVVINAHSWSAIPVCSALEGLAKEERNKIGKSTSVIRLTFISAFVFPEGVSVEEAVGGPPPWWIINEDGTLSVEGFIPLMYHDADPAEAEEVVAKLKPHALATFKDKTRSAAWRHIPSSYMVCEDDRVLPVEVQDKMIAGVRDQGAEIEVERLFVSHSPYLVKPNAVADFVRRAAGEDIPPANTQA